mmetsp:Transcript_8393/g.12265  ORF Transcript_8393/g.12265 Transcript_8393/m.12265 type:complete len:216 (-) Transcript_8393:120-767(-)
MSTCLGLFLLQLAQRSLHGLEAQAASKRQRGTRGCGDEGLAAASPLLALHGAGDGEHFLAKVLFGFLRDGLVAALLATISVAVVAVAVVVAVDIAFVFVVAVVVAVVGLLLLLQVDYGSLLRRALHCDSSSSCCWGSAAGGWVKASHSSGNSLRARAAREQRSDGGFHCGVLGDAAAAAVVVDVAVVLLLLGARAWQRPGSLHWLLSPQTAVATK